ncbi:MAG TPA: hypothetical protein VGH28_33005 [Polyangiaceae bacterium]|jgi:hypothetical protein
MIRALTLAALTATLAVSSLAGCSADTSDSDPVDVTMTGSDALNKCTKKIYVHIISYGATDYGTILADKNGCWGMEAPHWGAGAKWSDCNTVKATTPSGGTRWTYDDINIGSATHHDASKILACKAANGGDPDIAYVAANSGAGWSHSGITGVARFFNECYDNDSLVKNRLSGCGSNGIPMWNIGASSSVYNDVLALCKSRPHGDWMGIYAATAGLKGKEAAIVKALNYCTTH